MASSAARWDKGLSGHSKAESGDPLGSDSLKLSDGLMFLFFSSFRFLQLQEVARNQVDVGWFG